MKGNVPEDAAEAEAEAEVEAAEKRGPSPVSPRLAGCRQGRGRAGDLQVPKYPAALYLYLYLYLAQRRGKGAAAAT